MEENKDKFLKQESAPARENNKDPEQIKKEDDNKSKQSSQKEESELTKEDLEILRHKEKIEDLKRKKKERIARENKKLKRKRDHSLIVFGIAVSEMLNIKDMLNDKDVERAKREIGTLLSMKPTLNKHNIYNNKQLENIFNNRSGMNNNDR